LRQPGKALLTLSEAVGVVLSFIDDENVFWLPIYQHNLHVLSPGSSFFRYVFLTGEQVAVRMHRLSPSRKPFHLHLIAQSDSR
jgi:hypothetical protein